MRPVNGVVTREIFDFRYFSDFREFSGFRDFFGGNLRIRRIYVTKEFQGFFNGKLFHCGLTLVTPTHLIQDSWGFQSLPSWMNIKRERERGRQGEREREREISEEKKFSFNTIQCIPYIWSLRTPTVLSSFSLSFSFLLSHFSLPSFSLRRRQNNQWKQQERKKRTTAERQDTIEFSFGQSLSSFFFPLFLSSFLSSSLLNIILSDPLTLPLSPSLSLSLNINRKIN